MESNELSPSLVANSTPLRTPDEIATLLNVSPKTIYYWVSRNEIPYLRVGRHLRFNQMEVMKHFEMQTQLSLPACRQPGAALNLLVTKSRSLTTRKIARHATVQPKD